MAADTDELLRRCDELAAISEEPGARVEGWMREAGLGTRIDAVGNVVGRREGADPGLPALLVGSHRKLGVLAGIALAARLARAQVALPFALEIVGFAGEERRPAGSLLGSVELQIEQGPVLASSDKQIGVGSAIAGRTRARLELVGEAGHAGTVPMALRRDPLLVAAKIVQLADATARARQGVVATVGELIVEPGAADEIPGRVTLALDLQADDDATRLEAWEELAGGLGRLAAEGRVELHALELEHTPAVQCDPRLRALLRAAAAACGIDAPLLTSGAGHDPVAVTPVAMLFVRSPGGVDDIAVALDVLEEFVQMLVHAQ